MKHFLFGLLILLFSWNGLMSQSPVHYKEGLLIDHSGNPFNGTTIMEETADGKAQRHSIQAENGLLHGEVIYYHSSGYVEEKGHYKHGKKEGTWSQYSSQGNLLGEAYYKEGLKDGIWTVWDEQGVKRYHMVYSMGKKVDTWKMWDDRAVLVSERTYGE